PGTLVWSDEFNDVADGKPDLTKWGYDLGGSGFGNHELQQYTDRVANAFVANGELVIKAQCEAYEGMQFTSARLTTKFKGDIGPGHRIDVRAKLPTGRGTWPAIWMLPSDWKFGNWPSSGEIDIMEHVGCDVGKVHGTVHTKSYNHMLNTQRGGTRTVADVEAWHVYSVVWKEAAISFYIDGVAYHTFVNEGTGFTEWPFSERFHVILNVAVGGDWGGYCLGGRAPSCADDTEMGVPQHMFVDYVRIY
ncbi:the Laminarinase from Rhodothermus Marinus, partial [Pavlovales sp. CCMP2436]